MMEPFPEEPKGMYRKTYMRMFCKPHEAEMEQLAEMRQWLEKLEYRLS